MLRFEKDLLMSKTWWDEECGSQCDSTGVDEV